MPEQRYKLTVSYRGTHYHGWQRQALPATWKGALPPAGEGLPTVQEKLTRSIQYLVGHPVSVVGSSRTDSGVHAKGQVAHFDTHQRDIPLESMRRAINARIPDDIIVRSIDPIERSFDAIASTISKRYQYFIWNTYDRPPFFSELCWHRWHPLDADAMARAAPLFNGEKDFASFARPGHKRETTIRTVFDCCVARRGPMVVIGIEGSGFLWNQVRIMVGTLVEVGMGIYPPERITEMLEARNRKIAGPTAPPQGLYLQWVKSAWEKSGETDDRQIGDPQL